MTIKTTTWKSAQAVLSQDGLCKEQHGHLREIVTLILLFSLGSAQVVLSVAGQFSDL